MPSLVFDTCCGCIELRTGCLVIAYLNLIGELIFIILGLLLLIGSGVVTASADSTEESALGAYAMALAVVILVMFVFALAFTIVLLVGLHQNKRGHVKAYLIYACIFFVVYVVTFLAGLGGAPGAGGIVQSLLVILLTAYFLLVIRSHYHKMDDKPRPPVYSAA